jgi:ribulose-phosphate 3-epimerase
MIDDLHLDCEIEIDGGIDEKTAPLGVAAGATVLVAGTSIFGAKEPITTAMQRLRKSVS